MKLMKISVYLYEVRNALVPALQKQRIFINKKYVSSILNSK